MMTQKIKKKMKKILLIALAIVSFSNLYAQYEIGELDSLRFQASSSEPGGYTQPIGFRYLDVYLDSIVDVLNIHTAANYLTSINSNTSRIGEVADSMRTVYAWGDHSSANYAPTTNPVFTGMIKQDTDTIPTFAQVRALVAAGSGFSYPDAGIVISNGSDWGTSITDNSTNWNTAYSERLRWDGGATGLTPSTGRVSLGATTVGSNLFTMANPGAVRYLRLNADNSVTQLSAAQHKSALGYITSGDNVSDLTNDADYISGTDTVALRNDITALQGSVGVVIQDSLALVNGDISFSGLTGSLSTDAVSANELNATGVENELEAVIDLQDLQGAVTDAQVPNDITISTLPVVQDTTDTYTGDVTFSGTVSTITADAVSADELNASGVESELEGVLDLQDLQGAVTDSQVPDDITISNLPIDSTSAGFGLDESSNTFSVDTTNDIASKARADTLAEDITSLTTQVNDTIYLGESNTLNKVEAGDSVRYELDTNVIDETHLEATNSPTNGDVLSYNEAGTNFTWVASSGGGGYDLLEFEIGVTSNAPAEGDSILVHTELDSTKVIEIWRSDSLSYLQKVPNRSYAGWQLTNNDTIEFDSAFVNKDWFEIHIRDTSVVDELEFVFDYNDEYDAVLAAMTTEPPDSIKVLQNAMVSALVDSGYWDRMDHLLITATNTEENALINWINPGTNDAISTETFTEYEGFQGDSASTYTITGFTPYDDVDNASLNSLTAGIYVRNENNGNGLLYDANASGRLSFQFSGNVASVYINSTNSLADAQSSTTGLWNITRRAADDMELYRNGVSQDTESDASTGLAQAVVRINRSSAGAGTLYCNFQWSVWYVIDGISDTDDDGLFVIFETYMDGLGKGVVE